MSLPAAVPLVATLVVLDPRVALVGAAAALPVLGLLVAERRVGRTRTVLGLPAPPRSRRLAPVVALLAVVGLLAAAAAQPALRSSASIRVRTDVEAMFVLDTSRSMLAAGSARGPNRFARAKRLAIALRAAIPEVPSGVANFTDRVLPNLLPSASVADFDDTVARAVGSSSRRLRT